MVEWLMGANRSDRATVRTSALHQRLPSSSDKLTALLCTQRDSSAGFGGGSAFLAWLAKATTHNPGLVTGVSFSMPVAAW